MRRLAIVVSHPVQYLAPWFRALARVVDVQVLYCHRQDGVGQAQAGFGQPFDWDVPLLDGYAWRFLDNRAPHPGVDEFGGCDTPNIGDVLEDCRAEACLVHGWYLKSYVQAIRACHRRGIPVLLRGDSQLRGPRRFGLATAKYLPYRWGLRRIAGCLYPGQANREYLEHYGVSPERLFFVPHFVDNEWFRTRAATAADDGGALGIRREARVPPRATVFLFAGKFVEKKRPGDFVAALAALRDRGIAAFGLMVGSGPLDAALVAQISAANAPVALLGFRNQTEMPACYAAADALVLPSDGRETWGLVVNEAMACGRPVVVSNEVGCGPDLVTPGITGETYPVGDVSRLADCLATLTASLENNRERLVSAARDRIARYSIDAAVAGTELALAQVLPAAPAATSEVGIG